MDCCSVIRSLNSVFDERTARAEVKRYWRKGLDRHARRIVAALDARGVADASVLEIGGGIGDIELELLHRGARRATNLELVDAYDAAARQLADAAGVSDRVTRRRLDLATTPGLVDPHDIVILHRVVCCYPDYERLLTAAADRARRLLVFSHPPRNTVSRSLSGLQHVAFRLTGRSFRTYTHPPAAMVAVVEGRGMRTGFTRRGALWQIVGLER